MPSLHEGEYQDWPPFVSELRAHSSFQTSAGGSVSGLFYFFTLFENPELFRSPAIYWERCWIMQRESDSTTEKAISSGLKKLKGNFRLESS